MPCWNCQWPRSRSNFRRLRSQHNSRWNITQKKSRYEAKKANPGQSPGRVLKMGLIQVERLRSVIIPRIVFPSGLLSVWWNRGGQKRAGQLDFRGTRIGTNIAIRTTMTPRVKKAVIWLCYVSFTVVTLFHGGEI